MRNIVLLLACVLFAIERTNDGTFILVAVIYLTMKR